MCQFFVSADPMLYESRTRSIRIHGLMTTIRLENLMWETLAAIAAREGRTTNALITMLHDEILEANGEVSNFASFLRVTCLRYFQREAQSKAPETPETAEAPEQDHAACDNGKIVSIAGR
jgi:predicted DNA-binding ribbon-helix-helix protein